MLNTIIKLITAITAICKVGKNRAILTQKKYIVKVIAFLISH